jgi:hypothetical protein
MTRLKQSDRVREILSEMGQQPQALRELTAYYCSAQGKQLLEQIPAGERVLFTAAGAELSLAEWAARQCHHAGLDACAVDTHDLADWPKSLLDNYPVIVLISPGKTAGELIDRIESRHLIIVTDDPDELSAQGTVLILPVFSGPKKESHCKPTLNQGIVIWLLCRKVTGCLDGSEESQLKTFRQRVQLLLEGQSVIHEQWQRCIYGQDRFALVGSGQQAFAATQTAVYLAAWADQQCSHFASPAELIDSLEMIGPGWAVVFFEENEPLTNQQALILPMLQEKGACCIRVVDGFPQWFSDEPRSVIPMDSGLAAFLNLISGQILSVHFQI